MSNFSAKILVIDDEKSVCISCKRILEEDGHTVEYVQNGNEGVRLAVEKEFNIILLDLKMPEISGQEALETIKSKRPGVNVIIITGYATIQTSIECIKKGAFDYIPKPFTPEELSVSVEKALDNHLLRKENEFLKSELKKSSGEVNIIGGSAEIDDVKKQILKIAPTDFNVLLNSESGTGKELIAHAIHENSNRKDKQFIAVDLSALTPTLIESELFGHTRGAFTGATQNRPGYFTMAHGGTLFLDEISNVSLQLQGKLLRALETRRIRPVGGEQEHEIDIRLITATNRDLQALVEKGEFREDLYYRINVIPITVPPLRERADDIPLLAMHFLHEAKKRYQSNVKGFTTEAMAKLLAYRWPGNVRELKNIIERLMATTDTEYIGLEHIPADIISDDAVLPGVEVNVPEDIEQLKSAKKQMKEMVYAKIERQFLIKALEEANWNITNAAKNTGFQRTNFHALMRKYGIKSSERDNT